MKNLYESTETSNYIVQYSEEKQRWELKGKLGNRTYFMKSCQFQVPLLVAQRDLEDKKKTQLKLEKHRAKVATKA